MADDLDPRSDEQATDTSTEDSSEEMTDEDYYPESSTEYKEYDNEDLEIGSKGGSARGDESSMGDLDEADYPLNPEDQDLDYPESSTDDLPNYEDDEF